MCKTWSDDEIRIIDRYLVNGTEKELFHKCSLKDFQCTKSELEEIIKERTPIVEQREWENNEIELIHLYLNHRQITLKRLRSELHCRNNNQIMDKKEELANRNNTRIMNKMK